MSAVCANLTSAYACPIWRDFSDQCEYVRLDRGPNVLWSNPICIKRFHTRRGLIITQLSHYSRTECIRQVAYWKAVFPSLSSAFSNLKVENWTYQIYIHDTGLSCNFINTSTETSLSEAYCRSAIQEIPLHFWKLGIQYYIHNSRLLNTNMSHLNPVQVTVPYFSQIHFNVNRSFTPAKLPFPSGLLFKVGI